MLVYARLDGNTVAGCDWCCDTLTANSFRARISWLVSQLLCRPRMT
jgi:hypothetical protein